MSPLKKGPFIRFVEQQRRVEEARSGNKLTLPEAVSKFGMVWQTMTLEEREPFSIIAGKKPGAGGLRGHVPLSLTSDPTQQSQLESKTKQNQKSSASQDQEEFQSEEFAFYTRGTPKKFKEDFTRMLEQPKEENKQILRPNPPNLKEIQKQSWRTSQCHRLTSDLFGNPTRHEFVHIHVTIYARTDEGDCIPGEIGIAVFSLERGLIDNYSILIDPGAPPLGYANAFMQCRKKHALPDPPYNPTNADYGEIWNSLERFLARHPTHDTDGTYLFAGRENVPIVDGALKWLAGKAGKVVTWEIFSFGTLLFELSKSGRKRYLEWLNEQRYLDVLQNPNSPFVNPEYGLLIPKKEPNLIDFGDVPTIRATSTLAPIPEEVTDTEYPSDTSRVTTPSLVTSTEVPSTTPSSVVTITDKQSASELSNGVVEGSVDSEPPNDESEPYNRVCNWGPEEAAIVEVDLNMVDTSMPIFLIPNYFGRARRIPRTAASRMSDLIDRFTPPALEGIHTRNGSTVITTMTPLDVPHDPKTGNYRDKELFVTVSQANEFLESLDFASMVELACPFHMMNTRGCSKCPLNIVNRNIYNSLDILIGHYHIRPTEGAHFPHLDPARVKFVRESQVTRCAYMSKIRFKSDESDSE